MGPIPGFSTDFRHFFDFFPIFSVFWPFFLLGFSIKNPRRFSRPHFWSFWSTFEPPDLPGPIFDHFSGFLTPRDFFDGSEAVRLLSGPGRPISGHQDFLFHIGRGDDEQKIYGQKIDFRPPRTDFPGRRFLRNSEKKGEKFRKFGGQNFPKIRQKKGLFSARFSRIFLRFFWNFLNFFQKNPRNFIFINPQGSWSKKGPEISCGAF